MLIERLEPDLKLAAALFDSLSRATRCGRGIVRDSYGAGEQAAHDIMRTAAESMGLEISIDAIGNLMMTLPGHDRLAPRIIIGSHLDTVPRAGAFDGILGVILGIALIEQRNKRGFKFDLEIAGFSEEEGVRFAFPFIGSRALTGDLSEDQLMWVQINAEKSSSTPVIRGKQTPLKGAEERRAALGF